MKSRALVLMALLCLTWLSPARADAASGLKIVAGTSLIEDIVQDLTGGQAAIRTLIPGSFCPGHDTAKTTDFVFAAGADLVLIHPFQRDMPGVDSVLETTGNGKRRLVALEPRGSWLIPETQKQAVRAIAAVLEEAAPEQAETIAGRARERIARVDRAVRDTAPLRAAIRGKAVAAASMQAEFVAWAGMTVIAQYGREEDMSPRAVVRLVEDLRGKPVAGIVDNFQSGADAGLPVALELGLPHAVLSNFPGFSETVPDYCTLLRHNLEQLARLGG